MKKITLSVFILILFIPWLKSQADPDAILMTIGGRNISVGEFERIYRKNNNDNVTKKQTVEEYLDMFINYKLKVIEAEELGMDTVSTFINELKSYTKQLAQPYLTNPEIKEYYAKEAYDRMREEINASHIMIRLGDNPSPEDTLKAYDKLMDLRKKAIDGEDFETLARFASEDPSARTNGGDLGWFSVFRMVYPFETTAYNTPVGEVSMPFRSEYGMHILKVYNRRPTKGQVKIAHIFIRAPESMTREEAAEAKEKAYGLVDSLKNGADFARLAEKYSDDRSSAEKGGEIPWIRSGQMIKVFDDAAFSIKNPGEFSEAVKSSFGYHIIKLLDKKPVGSYEEEKPGIMDRMKSGERANINKDAFISSLKKEYNFNLNNEILDIVISRIDTSLVNRNWDKSVMDDIMNETLFSCGDSNVKVAEFANALTENKMNWGITDPSVLARKVYSSFEKDWILKYEESRLPDKYPEFKNIIQEYHDGILLFDLTDKTIWSKAVEDSIGLENFYKENKNNYKWDQRADASLITVLDSAKIGDVRKFAARLVKKKKFSSEALMKEFCQNDTTGTCISVEDGLFEKEDNQYVDKTGWKKGMGEIYYANDKPSFVVIKSILGPSIKELSETRGQVTADYQTFLEGKWIQELRNKYEIEINRELLKQIKDQ